MNKEHLHFTIGVSCIVAFFFLWVGIYVGRKYQKDIYRDKANQVLAETKELKRQADLQLYTTDKLMKSIKERVDSITVVKTIYIKK